MVCYSATWFKVFDFKFCLTTDWYRGLAKIIGKRKVGFIGLTMAGFGLLFFGIQFLQDAMSGGGTD